MADMTPLLRAEIDLDAIAHNVRELRRITRPKSRLMAVVKANAYGHGVAEVARQALKSGADCLGVARLDEGIQLRKAGFADASILIFGPTPLSRAGKIMEFDLTQTVCSYESAHALSDIALSHGRKIRVHFKTDTGMGRLGTVLGTASDHRQQVAEVASLASLQGLELEGIFTHFAASDSADKSFTQKQFGIFTRFLSQLRDAGLNIPVRHAANSGAIIDHPETHLDMVRAGISLYGLYPSDEVDKSRLRLQPAMTLKSGIVHLKQVPAGFKISYGMTYETKTPTAIATVSVGYADGFSRLLSSQGHMLVRGQKAPIVGRVCMDLTMLDVGHIPDVCPEDEVVIIGKQGDASVTADEIATTLGTINYEIVSSITARVPRIYSI